jgi:hypothetical protein
MWSGVEAQVLSNHARVELASLTELVTPGAIDLNSLDAELLAQLEILIGSWGCNLLDASLLVPSTSALEGEHARPATG